LEQMALTMSEVCKAYGRRRALNALYLEIPRGTVVGILGPNGSGKSTTLRILAGITFPDSGQVQICGERLSAGTRRLVAYLPEIDAFYPWMTVRDHMRFVEGLVPDWSREREGSLMELMNLEYDSRISVLSRGMRARLKLVTVLSRTTPVVLLDEPLSGIDPGSRRRIVRALIDTFAAGDQTMLISTHEVDECEPLLDRAAFLREGQVIIDENCDDLRAREGKSLESLMGEMYS
jgi:ABC-2 type transport system ATP-binding protein